MAADNLESQMLTDRQKEVKERQGREAALFPDIRSSPRGAPSATEYRLPKLAFKPNEAPTKLQVDEETSPSFPPDAMMNDFLGSSPTPSSSRKRSEEPYSDDGPPSSPPLVTSRSDPRQALASPQLNYEAMNDAANEEINDLADEPMAEASPVLPPTIAAGIEVTNARSKDVGKLGPAALTDVGNNPMSELDVYVDAPTEPSRDFSSDPQDPAVAAAAAPTPKNADANATQLSPSPRHSNVSHITESFQTQRSPHIAAEDEEVTAQLMNEMALSSSKRMIQTSASGQQAVKPIKKRKMMSADEARKRRKGLSPNDGPVSEPSSGEVVADCVLIDGRPSSSNAEPTAPKIKAEPSASPSFLASSIGEVEEAPIVGRMAGRPANTSRKSYKASKEPASLRRSVGKVRVKAEQEAARRTSGRLTRISSRLNDVTTSSPNRSEASFSSVEHADSDPVPWTYGPSGSRWAYVPATAPANPEPTAPRSAAVPANHESTTLRPEEVASSPNDNSEVVEVVEAAKETPTATGILQGFRSMLESIKKVTLRPEDERTMVGLLFESVQQVHEAGRRHTTT